MGVNLIVLGAPGAGKGTQAERFARSRGIPKISTGDILREAVHTGTEIGRRAREVMDRGELVSDDVMIGIVRERLEKPDALGGFVLDGFPRTVPQAAALDAIMAGRGPLIVIDIVVPEQELARRLGARMICDDCGANAGGFEESTVAAADHVFIPAAASIGSAEGGVARLVQTEPLRCRRCGGGLVQRADDSAQVVLQRFRVYQRATRPLVDFYCSRPTFKSINGAQALDQVAVELARAIDVAMHEARTQEART